MMEVRRAFSSDRDRVVELLRASREGAGFDTPLGPTGFVFPFVRAYAERLFDAYVKTPLRLCLVLADGGAAVGVLMAHVYEHDFGPVWVAQERVWWIDPAHRGRGAIWMLDRYEQWAQIACCKYVFMAGMGADPEVAKLYLRRGYLAAERNFIKPVARA